MTLDRAELAPSLAEALATARRVRHQRPEGILGWQHLSDAISLMAAATAQLEAADDEQRRLDGEIA